MKTFDERIQELVKAILDKREQLVHAWIAETGLMPSESMLITQYGMATAEHTWVQRREHAAQVNRLVKAAQEMLMCTADAPGLAAEELAAALEPFRS